MTKIHTPIFNVSNDPFINNSPFGLLSYGRTTWMDVMLFALAL